MEREQQHDIEQAIRILPHIPAEYHRAQAARITGMILPQLRRWAPSFARKVAADHQDFEDITQIAALAVLETLHEFADGQKHQNVGSWFPYLCKMSEYSVVKHHRSGASAPMSGRANLDRRIARIPQAIDRLRQELLRDPTAQEVVDAHNAEMHRRQKNPAKHGSLITTYDAQAFL